MDHSGGLAGARQKSSEELANVLTHAIGFALGAVGLLVAVAVVSRDGNAWAITSVTIYGITLVALYFASMLYHAARSPRWRSLLRKLDHVAIFLFIAGTYTPFVLVNLRGPWGWSLFGVVWAVALVGGAFKLRFAGRHVRRSTAIYIALGWVVLVAIKPLAAAIPTAALALLVIGGLCYTGGAAFYLWRRLPYHHALWHLFVLAGSICHYFAVLASVV